MEEMEILKKLEKVKAPPDFEQKVMAELSLRRRSRLRRRLGLQLSLAGAVASLLVGFVLWNFVVIGKRNPLGISPAGREWTDSAAAGPISGSGRTLPIIETLDYSLEVRNRGQAPQAVYLLEQVSDKTPKGVRF